MKGLKSLKDLFHKWFNLNLKSLDAIHRRALMFNIFFPGMGFIYAGFFFRGIITGIVVVLLMGAGVVTSSGILVDVAYNSIIKADKVIMSMAYFSSAILIHLLAVVMTGHLSIRYVYKKSAYLYIAVTCSVLVVVFSYFVWVLFRSFQEAMI